MIVPCIDISNGRVVQWRQGREPVLQLDGAEEVAERFGRFGEIAVIDLDAALGRGDNTALVERLCRLAPCRVGGGLRTVGAARRMLKAGARRVIIGTRASSEFFSEFPRSTVMAAIDVDGDDIVDHGWQRRTGEDPLARIARLAPFVSGFVYTTVDREGTRAGADMIRFEKIAKASAVPIAVAGGIASVDEVVMLDRMGVDCHVGLSIYTGDIDLADAFVACVDFDKGQGLVPAVVSDSDGRTRMHAWMNGDALRATLDTGVVHFWSRSRACLWRKGESSGHTLRCRTVRADCDRDAIHVVAESSDPTCHRGTMSCFCDDAFQIEDLARWLVARARSTEVESGTARLARDPALLRAKLIEEAGELADANGSAHIAHEAADVMYHVFALLASRGVPWTRVVSELSGRRRCTGEARWP